MSILKKHDLTGHDVFEFMRGPLEHTHWLEDSIYMTEETLAESKLLEVLTATLPEFNYYGPTVVTKEMWEIIKQHASVYHSKSLRELVDEIDVWAVECFKEQECFTICGV